MTKKSEVDKNKSKNKNKSSGEQKIYIYNYIGNKILHLNLYNKQNKIRIQA